MRAVFDTKPLIKLKTKWTRAIANPELEPKVQTARPSYLLALKSVKRTTMLAARDSTIYIYIYADIRRDWHYTAAVLNHCKETRKKHFNRKGGKDELQLPLRMQSGNIIRTARSCTKISLLPRLLATDQWPRLNMVYPCSPNEFQCPALQELGSAV